MNKHFALILFSIFACLPLQAQETGPANSVMRVPAAGGKARLGPLNLTATAATTGFLGISKLNGLTPGGCVFGGTGGVVLQPSNCFWDIANNSLGLGNAPVASAILDVASTTKGALLPRMTTTQRDAISSPAPGLIIFNTTRGHFQQYVNGGWIGVGANLGETSVAQSPAAALQVDTATRGFLGPRLTSVQRDAITTPPAGLEIYNTTTNQKNVYNGSAWVAVGSGAGGGEGVNLLTMNGGNNDAEQGTNGWTASGGTFATTTTSNYNGLASFQWQATAIGQTLDSTAYMVPQGFLGRKCQVHLPYVGYIAGATGDYSVTVVDGTNATLASVPVPTMAGITQNIFQAFDCPAPGATMKIRVISNVATPTALIFDDAFLGQGRRSINTFGAIQQALIYTGGITIGATTTAPSPGTIAQNQTGYARFGDHALLALNFKTTAVGTAGSGDYLFPLPSPLQFDQTKTQFDTVVHAYGVNPANRINHNYIYPGAHISDSTNQIDGYVVPYDATRYRICGLGSTVSGSGVQSGCMGSGNYSFGENLTPKYIAVNALVPIAGWLAERAPVEGNTYDTVGWRVDANQIFTNSFNMTAGNVTTLTPMESSAGTMTNVTGRGAVPALSPCAVNTAPTGSTCDPANEQYGVAFNIPKAQDVKVCAQFVHHVTVNSGGGNVDAIFKLFETPPTATTQLQGGKTAAASTVAGVTMTHLRPITLCETFTFASAGLKTIRIFYTQSAANGVQVNQINADGFNGRSIRWNVEPMNEEMPAPVFSEVAKKLEGSTAGWRVESVNLGTNCAIQQQSGFVASTTQFGTNSAYCNIAFAAGKFSAPPSCTVTSNQASTIAFCFNDTPTSTSGVSVVCFNTSSTALAIQKSVVCMGPK